MADNKLLTVDEVMSGKYSIEFTEKNYDFLVSKGIIITTRKSDIIGALSTTTDKTRKMSLRFNHSKGGMYAIWYSKGANIDHLLTPVFHTKHLY